MSGMSPIQSRFGDFRICFEAVSSYRAIFCDTVANLTLH